jgi:2-C-methyl-D-erythritol 4-phosphate cytidylyltransferase
MDDTTKKPYLHLLGEPILTHTIRVFDQHPIIDAIYVIVAAEDFSVCESMVIAPYGFQKVAGLVAGGETRQASVFNGVQSLPPDTDFVIVHDGVRPFVTDEITSECVHAAAKWGAAVAAVPVKDTIKVADDAGFIVDTPDRQKLWVVQTPQAFRKSLLLDAHQQARQRRDISATDDAMLVEHLGVKVKLIMGSYANLKITTPEDLIIAESLKAIGSHGT